MILKKKVFHLSLDSKIMQTHSVLRGNLSWVSSNGAIKFYKDLDTNHLKNIIAKIERGELDDRLHSLFDLKNELDYRKLNE